MMHLYSEESEWNMLEVLGKGLGDQKKGRAIIADNLKERCRQEVMNVCGGGEGGGEREEAFLHCQIISRRDAGRKL